MRLHWFGLTTLIILLTAIPLNAADKDDVVVLKNGDRMTGEIKGLQQGELTFKASYMAESVRLDWSKVERLESKSTFMIFLVDGKILTNVLRLLPANSTEIANFVIGSTRDAIKIPQLNVIRILPADTRFWKRFEGSIDFGLSFTSGNDQYQTELTASSTYRTGNHAFTASIDSAFSGQTKGSSTKRNQFLLDYRKQLTPRWYAGALLELLHSDQQSLALRTSVGGLIGRNVLQTERTRLSLYGGAVGTREIYDSLTQKPRSTNADALAGVDFVTFRFSKAEVRSRLSLFPSLSTFGRTRLQASSDVHFKIVKDLWWGFHLYENYDSKPPIRADKNDLGISTTLGWKF